MIATLTAPNPTIEYMTTDAHSCPTCGTPMDEVRPNVWVCPVARTEARVISDERRAQVAATAAERVEGISF